MKLATILLGASLLSGVISQSVQLGNTDCLARETDVAIDVDAAKILDGPIKRQDAGLPPACFDACLMEGVTASVGPCG